jgi:hypothetical protein
LALPGDIVKSRISVFGAEKYALFGNFSGKMSLFGKFSATFRHLKEVNEMRNANQKSRCVKKALPKFTSVCVFGIIVWFERL